MKKVFFIAVIFIFLSISLAPAQTSIKAEVDKTSIAADEMLTYKVIITSPQKQLPQPQIPKFDGFNVVSQAHSSTVSLKESKIKTILVYAYILTPQNTGKFTIEPTSIKIKDSILSSQSFEIEVKPGKSRPQPKPQEPTLPRKPQPETEQPQITL